MSPDLYDDLHAYLSKEAEGDLVDGRWKPNKAMSLLQRLEEECAQDVRGEAMEECIAIYQRMCGQMPIEDDDDAFVAAIRAAAGEPPKEPNPT